MAHRNSTSIVAANLRVAVPCILVGGALGAMIGSALGSVANGFRVGVVLGGVFAFAIIRRRKRNAS